jgi:hypothetical protein
MKKHLFFAIFAASCVFTSNAQTKSEVQIGLAMPQGDFADDDEDDAIYDGSGVARTGLYLGYKQLSPLSTDGLYWTLSAGIMYNDLQSDFKEDWEDWLDDTDDYRLPKYVNVPILVGIHYEKTISDELNFFGEAGLGPNILKLTKYAWEEDNYEDEEKYNPSMALGLKIGGGIVLQDGKTVALNYLGLGSHKVKYEYEYSIDGFDDSDDDRFDKALSVSSLNITFGIPF